MNSTCLRHECPFALVPKDLWLGLTGHWHIHLFPSYLLRPVMFVTVFDVWKCRKLNLGTVNQWLNFAITPAQNDKKGQHMQVRCRTLLLTAKGSIFNQETSFGRIVPKAPWLTWLNCPHLADRPRDIPPTKNALVHYRPKRNGIMNCCSPNRNLTTLVEIRNLDWEKF